VLCAVLHHEEAAFLAGQRRVVWRGEPGGRCWGNLWKLQFIVKKTWKFLGNIWENVVDLGKIVRGFFSFLNWDIIDKKGGKVCITRQRVRKLKKDVKMK